MAGASTYSPFLLVLPQSYAKPVLRVTAPRESVAILKRDNGFFFASVMHWQYTCLINCETCHFGRKSDSLPRFRASMAPAKILLAPCASFPAASTEDDKGPGTSVPATSCRIASQASERAMTDGRLRISSPWRPAPTAAPCRTYSTSHPPSDQEPCEAAPKLCASCAKKPPLAPSGRKSSPPQKAPCGGCRG
eukprot:6214785-Pleurochrysis_carterae.AAC.1